MNYYFSAFSPIRKYLFRSFMLVLIFSQIQHAAPQISIAAGSQILTTLFRAIDRQSGYFFLYDMAAVRATEVNVNWTDCSIQQIVRQLDQQTTLVFRVSDKQI